MGVRHLRLVFSTLNASSSMALFAVIIIRYLVLSSYRPTLSTPNQNSSSKNFFTSFHASSASYIWMKRETAPHALLIIARLASNKAIIKRIENKWCDIIAFYTNYLIFTQDSLSNQFCVFFRSYKIDKLITLKTEFTVGQRTF